MSTFKLCMHKCMISNDVCQYMLMPQRPRETLMYSVFSDIKLPGFFLANFFNKSRPMRRCCINTSKEFSGHAMFVLHCSSQCVSAERRRHPRCRWQLGNSRILRTRFFGEYSNLKSYRILHAKHTVWWTKYRGNSRNLQEVWSKVWEEREQVRHGASEVGNGCWNPRAVYMPGSMQQHLSHIVLCHWMTGKEVGLGCVSVPLLWCSAPRMPKFWPKHPCACAHASVVCWCCVCLWVWVWVWLSESLSPKVWSDPLIWVTQARIVTRILFIGNISIFIEHNRLTAYVGVIGGVHNHFVAHHCVAI